jgi:hypothetical protein
LTLYSVDKINGKCYNDFGYYFTDVLSDIQNDIVAIASNGFSGYLALKADGRLIYWDYQYNEKTGQEEPVQSIIANAQDGVVGISEGMILKLDGTVLFYEKKEGRFTELNGVNLGPLPEFATGKKGISQKHDGKTPTSIKITIGEKTAYVDGKPYTLDVAPFLDALGAEVEFWNTSKDGKTLTIVTDGQTEIVMPVGEDSLTSDGLWKYIILNGKQVILNCPPRFEDTTTMVPLEYYGETLGAKVIANINTKEFLIEKGENVFKK